MINLRRDKDKVIGTSVERNSHRGIQLESNGINKDFKKQTKITKYF